MHFTQKRDNNGSLLSVVAVQERVAFPWHHTAEISSKIKKNITNVMT
jgi:hypothetical protein